MRVVNGWRFDTVLAEAIAAIGDPDGAIVPALQPATTFERDAHHQLVGEHLYRRISSPTVTAAESVVATLDGGAGALLFSSGMAAVTAFFARLPRGARVLVPSVMYHGVQDWLRRLHDRGDVSLSIFDRLDASGLEEALDGEVDVVWIETPTNPSWDVIDIRRAATATHAAGGELVVDSTVAPPVTTRPLELGADIVFHSATKYLNGHSDVTAGVLVTSSTDARWEELRALRTSHGSVLSPFDTWLLLRGLRTLGVRYRRASATALAIATHFLDHPGVHQVLYPGLPSHPGHEVAVRQMTGGFGGMMSIRVNGRAEVARNVAVATRIFTTATSLGGTESLIEHRASVEGPNSVVPDDLLRISIGLEDAADLVADLEQALASA